VTRPRPPRDLSAAGRALWRAIWSGVPEDSELDERETAVLHEACRQADLVARLEADLAGAPLTYAMRNGGERINPVVNALNTSRSLLVRALGQLELTDAELAGAPSVRSLAARRAAQARWAAKRSVDRERVKLGA
jgi:hypothetical protein